jgi:3,4-dihydroxy 2-butanone 4-phosphate synthase/GTP cyclohydrolase II
VFAREHGLKIGSIADLIRHRLETEATIERVDEREVETEAGPFRLLSYRDRIAHDLHFALVRGTPDPERPLLVRVHVKDVLSDVLRVRNREHVAVTQALAAIAAEGCGALVVLAERHDPDTLLDRLRNPGAPGDPSAERVREWRRNGAGAQILADLGARRLRVLGTPRRLVALSGFGLEVVDYVAAESAVPGA